MDNIDLLIEKNEFLRIKVRNILDEIKQIVNISKDFEEDLNIIKQQTDTTDESKYIHPFKKE
jgi:hypothetical protein